MRTMICESCGKHYDFDKDESCPKCGAYNHPDWRRKIAANRVVPQPALSQRHRPAHQSFPDKKKSTANRPTGWKAFTGVVAAVVLIQFISMLVGQGCDSLSEFELPTVQMVESAPASDQGFLDENDGAEMGDFRIPLTDPDSQFEFMPEDGVQFIVKECGLLDGEVLADVLDDEKQYIYVDLVFRVVDWDQALSADLTEPYLRADKRYYYSVLPEKFSTSPYCNPIDFSPIGARETDTVSGQMYFALPKDVYAFDFCWDSEENRTESIEISF